MSCGVSIVICCYNSAGRLPRTLAHVAAQAVPAGLPWEVIVVDNASSDDTAALARRAWPAAAPAPLLVVAEPEPGLSHARRRGLAAARFGILSFIDDDNWIAPNWVAGVERVLREHPDVGACGGLNEPVCEVTPPPWLDKYQYAYACGPQGQRAGDVTASRGFLWGAGLSVRRTAFDDILRAGFRSLLIDRNGANLAAGGDWEICAALRLAGWRLWYEPELRLRHFLPASRLEWAYLRRLVAGFGASEIAQAPYNRLLGVKNPMLTNRWSSSVRQVSATLLSLRFNLLRALLGRHEGEEFVLWVDKLIGRLKELHRRRRHYDESFVVVRDFYDRMRLAH